MSDMLEFRDLRAPLRRRWWVAVLLAVVGVGLGLLAEVTASPVYRAKGTVLVGPVSSTVIRSSTLRASESLAIFYADLARRQIVLKPVTERLNLQQPWDTLRDDVSAVASDENPRLITVAVLGESESEVARIAEGVLRQLVALSPNPAGGTEQQFLGQQTVQLKATITQAEAQIRSLSGRLSRSSDPIAAAALRTQLTEQQRLLNDWRRSYVELLAIDTGTDAGGLQIIDEVTASRSSLSVGLAERGALGGAAGAVVGFVIVLMLPRRRRGPDTGQPDGSGIEPAEPRKAVNGWPTPEAPSAGQSQPARARAERADEVDLVELAAARSSAPTRN